MALFVHLQDLEKKCVGDGVETNAEKADCVIEMKDVVILRDSAAIESV